MRRALTLWIVGALVSIMIADCRVQTDCDQAFVDGYDRPTPARACDMLAQLCPSRLAKIDGKTCEQQVIASTPPFGSYQNKTTHNVLSGYGKNPDCIATVYYSQQCRQMPFENGCAQLHSACECGKLHGLTKYPYPPNPGDTICNPKLGEQQ